MNACVAGPVGTREAQQNEKLMESMNDEWARFIDNGVRSHQQVREWSVAVKHARINTMKVHLGRIFGLTVETGPEFLDGDKRKNYKYCVVFQGNRVVDQNWETGVVQDLGSSPASMETDKIIDAYG